MENSDIIKIELESFNSLLDLSNKISEQIKFQMNNNNKLLKLKLNKKKYGNSYDVSYIVELYFINKGEIDYENKISWNRI